MIDNGGDTDKQSHVEETLGIVLHYPFPRQLDGEITAYHDKTVHRRYRPVQKEDTTFVSPCDLGNIDVPKILQGVI